MDASSYLLVLNWPPSIPGGVNEVVLNLSKQLNNDARYRAIIAHAGWDKGPDSTTVRGIEVIGIRVKAPLGNRHPLKSLAGFLLSAPRDLIELARIIRSLNVEVINAHFPNLNIYIFLIARTLGIFRGRIILSFHGADVTQIQRSSGVARTAWHYAIRRADANVACSHSLREQLLQFSPDARILTIHNGVDTAIFEARPGKAKKRRAVLHIGTFEYKKAHDVLLTAFQALRGRLPDVALILVGATGPTLQRVRDLIVELNLSASVTIMVDLPHQQIPEVMQSADLFVLPSRAEPFGLVLLEAGATGLPVVATRVGGIPELIDDGVTGLLISPDDPAQLEEAMFDMLTDSAKAERLAQEWYMQVRTCWGWENTAKAYLDLVSPQQTGSR